jgi:co-chaperonin GroES (HSP10)
MSDLNNIKMTELKDIYKPTTDHIVVEFEIVSTKTKAGVELLEGSAAAKAYQAKQKPIMKIIHVAENVTHLKAGDWILPHPSFRPTQVPLIYNDASKGMQHMQIHVSDVMGIVDSAFATFQPTEKETIIN